MRTEKKNLGADAAEVDAARSAELGVTGKPTSGPWTIGDEDKNGQLLVEGPHFSICTCHHHCVGSIETEMRANASLISASPDLLAALKDAYEYISIGGVSDDTDGMRQIRAAIAKAEGR